MKVKAGNECPLTVLIQIDNDVYNAIPFRNNILGIPLPTTLIEICNEIYKQRHLRFVHQGYLDEHPSFGDKVANMIPFGLFSKVLEPKIPSEAEVSQSLKRLIDTNRVRQLTSREYVRSAEDCPENIRHLLEKRL